MDPKAVAASRLWMMPVLVRSAPGRSVANPAIARRLIAKTSSQVLSSPSRSADRSPNQMATDASPTRMT
jgi:hypothetical protein